MDPIHMQECGTPNAKLGEYLEAGGEGVMGGGSSPTFTIYQLPCRPRPPGLWYIFAYSSSPWYPHEYMNQYSTGQKTQYHSSTKFFIYVWMHRVFLFNLIYIFWAKPPSLIRKRFALQNLISKADTLSSFHCSSGFPIVITQRFDHQH